MDNKIPYPGYKTSKQLIEPIRLMYKELGHQDACIQLQELAVTHLEKCAVDMNEQVNESLKSLYLRSNIPHGTYSFEQMRPITYTSYLLVTYTLFEKMVKGCTQHYRKQNPEVDEKWINQADSEQLASLQLLVHNLPQQQRAQLTSPPEFRLLEYYRLVRIAGTHVDKKTSDKALKAFHALKPEDFQHFYQYPLISGAPNKPNEITFEDFKLFTRAIKYYSNILNDVCG